MTGRRAAALVGTAPTALLVVLVIGLPVTALLRVAGADGRAGVARALAAPAVRLAVLHTVTTSTAVTVLAGAAGAGLALASHRGRLGLPGRPGRPGRSGTAVMLAPLLLPEFVLAYSWSQAYGPSGLTDDLFGVTLPGLLGPGGIVVVLACHAVPLAYLAVAAGLAARREPELDQAARCSGAGPWTALRTVTVPLMRRPLAAAAVLVFAWTVNSFAVPQVLGAPAGYSTMSTLLYADLVRSGDPGAFVEVCVLASAMLLLALLTVGPADLRAALRWTAARQGPAAASARPRRSALDLFTAAGLATYLAGAVALPLLALLASAVARAPGLAPSPGNWTTANLWAATRGPAVPALGRSLALALAASVVLVVLTLAAVALRTHREGIVGTAVTAGFAVPGSALAIGLLIAYGRWLIGGWLIILLAYLGKFWALAHRPLTAAADRVQGELLQAARAAGAGAFDALRTVTLPLLATASATGAALVFLFSLHEVTMSSILYGPGSETFAVVVLDAQQLGDSGTTSALALVLSVPPLAAAAGWLLVRRRR